MGYQYKPLWRREFDFVYAQLFMKLDGLNKCQFVQDSMKCKTCETPVRVLHWTYELFWSHVPGERAGSTES